MQQRMAMMTTDSRLHYASLWLGCKPNLLTTETLLKHVMLTWTDNGMQYWVRHSQTNNNLMLTSHLYKTHYIVLPKTYKQQSHHDKQWIWTHVWFIFFSDDSTRIGQRNWKSEMHPFPTHIFWNSCTSNLNRTKTAAESADLPILRTTIADK